MKTTPFTAQEPTASEARDLHRRMNDQVMNGHIPEEEVDLHNRKIRVLESQIQRLENNDLETQGSN